MSREVVSPTLGRSGTASLIDELLDDPRHGWSIGCFGAVGEFIRDPDEPTVSTHGCDARVLSTSRAAIRIRTDIKPLVVPYDLLSGDGLSWSNAVAFCLPRANGSSYPQTVHSVGPDLGAVRAEDRAAWLFDLGVTVGHVRFCLRTRDARLLESLLAFKERELFGPEGGPLMAEVLRAQPHRVLLSPLGRIEVYSPIPPPDGTSPEGPHTHLLPDLVRTGRTHDANTPIPEGLQPVLMCNLRSPWRDKMGQRVPFDQEPDLLFLKLLERYGLPEENAIRRSIESAIQSSVKPQDFDWPTTRRGRAVGRLTLRRIARHQPSDLVREWRARQDRGQPD